MPPHLYPSPALPRRSLMLVMLALPYFAVATALQSLELMTQRLALRVSDTMCTRFRSDGVLVLGRFNTDLALPPLTHQGSPKSIHEHIGVRTECALAAALTCCLLRCEAVRDPVGAWGNGCTHAHDHYSYANLLEEPESSCVVVLPREPISLTLCICPRQIAQPLGDGGDEQSSMELAAPPPEPEFHLDAGDALVLRGDRTEPPGGIGGGCLLYHFAACEAADPLSLYRSPLVNMKAQLERAASRKPSEDHFPF